jgi:hypothetical protein
MAMGDYLISRSDILPLIDYNVLAQFTSPLVLDLNSDGEFTISLADSEVEFDLNGDGKLESVGWVSAKDGLLAIDNNGDGTINDGSELFGTAYRLSDGSSAKDGYEALSSLDSNQDGRITAADASFGSLKVWRDRDSDGVTDAGELSNLMDMGIESLDLSGVRGPTAENGNIVGITSTYTTSDGGTHQMADVWFRTNALTSPVMPAIEDPTKKNIV